MSSALKRFRRLTPDSPANRRFHTVGTSSPNDVTMPTPVITTRRIPMVFVNDMYRNLSPGKRNLVPGRRSTALVVGPRGGKYTIRLMIHCHCKLLVLLLQRVSGLQPRAGTGQESRGGSLPAFSPYRFNQLLTDEVPGGNINRGSYPS